MAKSKEADAGNINYTYFQEFIFSNLTKDDSLEHCVVSYALKDILMIRVLHDAENVDPCVKWGPSKFYLLNVFVTNLLHIVLELLGIV